MCDVGWVSPVPFIPTKIIIILILILIPEKRRHYSFFLLNQATPQATPYKATPYNATVESDLSIVQWETDGARSQMEHYSLEGIMQCKEHERLKAVVFGRNLNN